MMKAAPRPPPEPKYVLRGGMGPVSCIEFGTEDILYAGTEDGWVHVWDLTINRKRCSFQVGNASCLAVKVISNKIISQTKGEGITIWRSSEEYALTHKYNYSYIGFCRFEMNWHQTHIFLPGENAEVKVFDLTTNKVSNELVFPADKLGEIMLLKYAKYCMKDILFIGYESGDMYLWDLSESTLCSQFKFDNVPMAIDFDEEHGKGVCGTESNLAIVFKIDAHFKFSIENSLALKNPGVSSVVIRCDKKIVVLGCWDGNVRVYSWKSGRILAVLSEHSETINALCYSQKPVRMWSSIVLAAASKDKSISMWSFL